MSQALNHGSTSSWGLSPFDLEPMEARRLLTATVSGELTVTGTKLSDTIIVRLSATDATMLEVVENAVTTPFAVASVDHMRILGLEGRDTITIDDANGVVAIPAFVGGGHGNDSITGGAGDSTLNGGNGDDVITGGGGDDEIEGGRGNDSLTGGEGQDTFPSSDQDTEITDMEEGTDAEQLPVEEAPVPVQNRINRVLATEPGTKLESLTREEEGGVPTFEAEFQQRRFTRTLTILGDGTVREDETEVEINQLPAHVRRGVFAEHPTAMIEETNLRLFAKRRFFEVRATVGNEEHEMLFTERGRLISDEVEDDVSA